MTKFYGVVAFSETVETTPGVWTEEITERYYYGDITRDYRKWQSGDSTNDNYTISNTLSIMADEYAYENFYAIRYVNWMGVNWAITSAEVQYPRLILSVGGVYNV
jgi:hypothetical protein